MGTKGGESKYTLIDFCRGFISLLNSLTFDI